MDFSDALVRKVSFFTSEGPCRFCASLVLDFEGLWDRCEKEIPKSVLPFSNFLSFFSVLFVSTDEIGMYLIGVDVRITTRRSGEGTRICGRY